MTSEFKNNSRRETKNGRGPRKLTRNEQLFAFMAKGGLNAPKKKRGRRGKRKSARQDRGPETTLVSSAPSAIGSLGRYKDVKRTEIYHKEYGTGVRVEGSQFVCTISSAGGSSYGGQCPFQSAVSGLSANAFCGIANSSGSNFTGIYFSPVSCIGRLQYEAIAHTNYAFRRIRFTYRSATSTSSTGIIAYCINRDPVVTPEINVAAGNVPNFGTLVQCVPNVNHSIWKDGTLTYSYAGDKVWEIDNPALQGNVSIPNDYPGAVTNSQKEYSSLLRDTVQCRLAGIFTQQYASAVVVGILEMDYVCDLYGPISPSAGSAVGIFGSVSMLETTSTGSTTSDQKLDCKITLPLYSDVVKRTHVEPPLVEEPRSGWSMIGSRRPPSIDLNKR